MPALSAARRLGAVLADGIVSTNADCVPLSQAAPEADRRALMLVGVSAAALWMHRYLVLPGAPGWLDLDGFGEAIYWALATISLYLALPMLVLLAAGGKPGDFGMRLPAGESWRPVAGLAAGAALLGFLAAQWPSFAATYPLWRSVDPANDVARTASFELIYAVQFVAVEFLFRGILIHAVRHRLGAWSIPFAAMPYMMIHFGKPPAEAAAAFLGGLLLGHLSLVGRSILPGVALHVALALTVDATLLLSRAAQ